MRLEIRTLSRAMSTIALLFVLVFGASLDVAAQRRGRDNNRGNHYGWTRGRRVGQQRNNNWRWRRAQMRRDRRHDRGHDRRARRHDRRDDRRDWRRDRSDRR